MKNILFYLSLFLVLFSCSNNSKPDYLLPKEKMVELMTDVQVAEAYIKLKFTIVNDTIQNSDSIYAAILRKHGISKAVYDSNFAYYKRNPEKLQLIYEDVLIELSALDAKNEAEKKKDPIDSSLKEDPVSPIDTTKIKAGRLLKRKI